MKRLHTLPGAVIAAGGYRTATVGEDMELVVRLHRLARLARRPYRIAFVPDPICWTEAPEDLRTLRSQRTGWQRGLAESLSMNMRLCCHPRGGVVGWLAFPFMLVFELVGPLIEVAGFALIAASAWLGWLEPSVLLIFLAAAVGLGVLLSVSALLLEEMSFHVYSRVRDTFVLLAAAVAENLGYRQLLAVWRISGLFRWLERNRPGVECGARHPGGRNAPSLSADRTSVLGDRVSDDGAFA